jgi:hypothetical protein
MKIGLRAIRAVSRVLVLAAATSAVAREAAAVDCSSTTTSHCWKDLTTQNYAQVVVGQTDPSGNGGQGLACAVGVSGSAWGCTIDCFTPNGPVNSRVVALLPNRADSLFNCNDASKRIHSIAIEPTGDGFWVEVLMSGDHAIWASWYPFPFIPDPELRNWSRYVLPQLDSNLANAIIPRQIRFIPSVGLVALATDNHMYRPAADAWDTRWVPFTTSRYPAGTNLTLLGSGGATQLGANGFSRDFGAPLPFGVQAPPRLPNEFSLSAAIGDPNSAFFVAGHTVPIAGTGTGYVITVDPFPFALGNRQPRLLTSRFVRGSFLPWEDFNTGTSSNMSTGGGLWTIEDAFHYRRRGNELFATGGSGHLFNWIP